MISSVAGFALGQVFVFEAVLTVLAGSAVPFESVYVFHYHQRIHAAGMIVFFAFGAV